jgi:hypothetical protein
MYGRFPSMRSPVTVRVRAPALAPPARRALASLAALGGGFVLGVALRALMFWSVVRVERLLAARLPTAFDRLPVVDPVYTAAALHAATDVRIQGLAIGGPLGRWLHERLPHVLLDPSLAQHGLARLAVAPGSPILGRLVAAGIAHAMVLAAGLVVVQAGRRRHTWPLVGAGLALQVPVALGILGARPSIGELEAAGLGFAATALVPWLGPHAVALSEVLTGAVRPLVVAGLIGLALAVCYVPGSVAIAVRGRPRAPVLASAVVVMLGAVAGACAWPASPAQGGSAPAPPLARSITSPTGAAPLPSAPGSAPLADAASGPQPPAAPTSDRWFAEPAAGLPSRVEVAGEPGAFRLLVDGQPEEIHGMGLNTRYAAVLSPDARAARLDADFAALDRLGVNTVAGWDPAEFDAVLLDHAARHGIGVVLPFALDPTADYTDPNVRAFLTDQVLAWVDRYRAYPALRLWGLGNEVLHKMVHPAWVGPQDPAREANARAFASWLVETADAVHALDPDHPVTYRSAEDAFLPWVLEALRQHGGGPRPWFVWGTNCYQDHLGDIVDAWPQAGTGGPLWVSEFAPGGLAVPDRPDGFRRLWGYVRRRPGWVLGGAVYAWTRDGPEAVDRTFGLTDDGVPVDGRSLDAIAELFHAP